MEARASAGFYLRGFWYDVGTTEAYEKLDNGRVEETFGFLD
jgi:NDP-sugar pyrophosphorylase family protein